MRTAPSRPWSSRSLAFSFAALASVGLGCSSSTAGNADDGGVQDGSSASAYTVLVTGTLKNDAAQSRTLHESTVGSAMAQAQAGGDVGHQAFLNKDTTAPDAGPLPLQGLTIDRWKSLDGLHAFIATPSVQTFLTQFYVSPPDVSAWQPQPGCTTWGSFTDMAPGATNYVITLRGRYKGDVATAEAAHNNIVANVPAPGAQGLGNSAHMIFVNPNDAGEILILEVWTNETNQEQAYMALGPVLVNLWAAQPAITRWSTTDWAHW